MKILIFTNHSYMLYRFRKELIQELMKHNDVVISTPFVGHEDDFKAMGLRCINTDVDRRGINPKTDLKLFFTYRRILKEECPDLVITYSIKPNIYAGLACAFAKIPYCANVQGLGTAFQRRGLAQFVTVLYRTALRKAKTVFFENQGNAQEFLNRNIIAAEKITLLPGAGINLNEYKMIDYPKNDVIRFLFLGRIMKEKGIDELFSAIRRLHDELNGKVVLDLVGFFDDDYESRVNQLVDDGIAVFHGFQSEPRPYYANADCVVLASYHEGMSNVLLEASACGRPVITSDIYGCREAVDADISGYLCKVQDAGSLYRQMLRMARCSAREREAMGRAARRKMEQEFEKQLVVQKTVKALFAKS
ncbi:MAG: glycosyltransferase family 4 protein [Ruminococcaceae bacterium]|nr:glycosyltransferase family 4 protein [Oscillospiraceae bacterium]